MKIYVVKTYTEEETDIYGSYRIFNVQYKNFLSEDSAKRYLEEKGYWFSPAFILCGNKIMRVCKTAEEAWKKLEQFEEEYGKGFFTVESTSCKDEWLHPDNLINANYYSEKKFKASIEEVEVEVGIDLCGKE